MSFKARYSLCYTPELMREGLLIQTGRKDINITHFSELRKILTETYFFSTSTFLLLEIAAPRRLHMKSVPQT